MQTVGRQRTLRFCGELGERVLASAGEGRFVLLTGERRVEISCWGRRQRSDIHQERHGFRCCPHRAPGFVVHRADRDGGRIDWAVVQSAVEEGPIRKIPGSVVFAGLSEEGEGTRGYSGAVPERGSEGTLCGVSSARTKRSFAGRNATALIVILRKRSRPQKADGSRRRTYALCWRILDPSARQKRGPQDDNASGTLG